MSSAKRRRWLIEAISGKTDGVVDVFLGSVRIFESYWGNIGVDS